MSKVSRVALAVLVTLLASSSALVLGAEKPVKVRVIHAVFTSETGQSIEFRVPEGRGVRVKSVDGSVTYRLVPKILSGDRVLFTVLEVSSETVFRPVDEIETSLDNQNRKGSLLPFSLGLKGIRLETLSPRGRATAQEKSVVSDAVAAGSCCVQCGGWEVCCEPAGGWCCDISSSCGSSCSVCNSKQ